MKITDPMVEAVAKALFELHPVSRSAKAWADLSEGGTYRTSFRYDAMQVLRVVQEFQQ